MKIDRKLNLVVPFERESGTIYVHAAPISREVFEKYFLVIAKTFAAVYSEGLSVMAGPRVAALLLKERAVAMGIWDGPTGVDRGLMSEVRRLSNVLAPDAAKGGGWATVPLQDAVDHGYMDADESVEVENILTFFIVVSAMHKRAELAAVLDGASRLWGGQITSLNCTEYTASLPTSTVGANTGVNPKPSSVPS